MARNKLKLAKEGQAVADRHGIAVREDCDAQEAFQCVYDTINARNRSVREDLKVLARVVRAFGNTGEGEAVGEGDSGGEENTEARRAHNGAGEA